MATKNLRVFVYEFKIPQNLRNGTTLKDKFSRRNVSRNIESYGDDYLLLLIEKFERGFLFGRFLKLRTDKPNIFNKRTTKEREIDLTNDENILEESHFILNLDREILFGEYNFHSVRHFSHPLMIYLKNKLGTTDIDIRPPPNPQTLALMKRARKIKEFEVSISQEKLSHKEQTTGGFLIGNLIGLSTKNESTIKIIVSGGQKKGNELKREEVHRRIEGLLERKEDLKSLTVVAENSKYDLLHGNLLSYPLRVNKVNNRISTTHFFRECENLYNQKINSILRMIRRD